MTPGLSTVIYSAPEMFLGRQLDEPEPPAHAPAQSVSSNTRLDIWSLGSILFEMMSGVRLVEAADRTSLVQIVQKRIGMPMEASLAKQVGEFTRMPACAQVLSGTESLVQLAASSATTTQWPLASSMLRWEVTRRPSATEAHAALKKSTSRWKWKQLLPSSGIHASAPAPARSASISERPLETTFGACRCSGRCRNGVCFPLDNRPGRGRRPCAQSAISRGGLCRACACVRPGCLLARSRGALCSADRHALDGMSWSLQMAHAIHTRRDPESALAQSEDANEEEEDEETDGEYTAYVDAEEAESFLPCDVTDFLACEATARKCVVNALLLAYLKDPAATAVYCEADVGKSSDSEHVGAALEKVFSSMDGSTTTGAKQISRQGVARWMGPAAVGRSVGLLRAPEATTRMKKRASDALAPAQGKRVRLGLTGVEYAVVPSSAVLERFTSACAPLDGAWESMFASGVELPLLASEVSDIVEQSRIGKLLHASTTADFEKKVQTIFHVKPSEAASSRGLPASGEGRAKNKSASDGKGYLHDFGMRKLMLLLLKNRVVDWERISMQELKAMSADQGNVLDSVPASWSSKESNSTQRQPTAH
jgi:hypothetical protein